jgi:probable phosphoglycerate mutase
MLTPVPFLFLRHGETDWNRVQRTQGRSDVPLNANGRDQARRARDLLGGLEIATVCSSPLERALETAALLQVSLGCGLKVLDDLAECCWGEREGQVKGQWFEDWKLGRRTPDGAEPYARFLVRALRGINTALKQPGPVLIVSHGGVYWTVQKHAVLDSEFDIPNAVPVRHDPPKPDYPWWTATVLEADR